MHDFVNGIYSDSLWDVEFAEFKIEPFFVLGKDYNISMYDDDDNELILNHGNNTFNEIEVKSRAKCIYLNTMKYQTKYFEPIYRENI